MSIPDGRARCRSRHEWTGEVSHDQGKLNEALASPDDFRFLEYSGLVVSPRAFPSLTDAVEKGVDSTVVSLDTGFDGRRLTQGSGVVRWVWPSNAYATDLRARSGGGPRIRSASVLRFCTMAARWNSSRAPDSPRRRMRSKPWWVFRCAKRISTLFLSSRDFSNSGVPMRARAWSRASSFTSRGPLRQVSFGQHLGFNGHGPQSRVLAR